MRYLWATWVVGVDPSGRAVRNKLDCDSFRLRPCLVNQIVWVSATYVGEALAYCVDLGRAGGVRGLVCSNCVRSDRDHTGTSERVAHEQAAFTF
jgi:hypothetical protein